MKPVDFRIAIVGEAGVGKTSLVNRYAKGNFCSSTRPTVGIDRSDAVTYVDNASIQLKILDVAGAHQFGYLSRSYLRTVDAIVFLYDISSQESFAFLPYWTTVAKSCRSNVVKVLAGNKRDLADTAREVKFRTAKTFADFEGMVSLEVSAKDGGNIDLLFHCIARELKVQREQRNIKQSISEQQISAKTKKFERGGFRRSSLPVALVRGVSKLCGGSRFLESKQNFIYDDAPLEWV